MARCLPQLLELNITTFVEYIDSRNQETDQTKEFSRREVNQSSATPGIMAADIWTGKGEVDRTLFTPSNKG